MVNRTSDWRDELGHWLKPFGSVGSQSTATNVPALGVRTDRSARFGERRQIFPFDEAQAAYQQYFGKIVIRVA